ncbi:MAG: single-stranded DNA-binding protein [Acidaminococcaceae bacterium]|nr:single-stranded DNA-binding protein [Acidaminococcaceae bacterium]
MNVIAISGNITDTPELRKTQSGTSVTDFRIAVKRDENPEIADFFTVVAWGGQAEAVSRFVQKGEKVIVKGKLRTRSYTDKNGNKRVTSEIVADAVEFTKSMAQESEKRRAAERMEVPQQQDFSNFELDTNEEDLPF